MVLNLENVAVIGAGLGGCAIAIALSRQGLPVTVYESRSKDASVLQSGVVLSPNGLRVMIHLGLYDRVKDKCYLSRYRCFKNDKDETISKVPSANEDLHGFCNHRLWRSIVLGEMKAMLAEQGVLVQYESRFEGIDSENETGVTFTINGSRQHASCLIASDGIHSTVRKYVAPGIEPYYTGVTAVIAHVPRTTVRWPYEDYERNATIQGKPSAIWFIPEDPEAKDIMVGLQVNYPEQSREDLDRLQQDKDRQVAFFQHGYDEHGSTAQSIIDAVASHKDTSYIWPFLKMSKIDKWYSNTGRVIMMGDAVHALPASSAQGVNQAFEDAYSLARLLISLQRTTHLGLAEGLESWQSRRENRIEAIFDWATNVTNVSRLPEEERQKLQSEGKLQQAQDADMSWLYGYDVEDDFKEFRQITPDGRS